MVKKKKKAGIVFFIVLFVSLTAVLFSVTYNILNRSVKNIIIENVNEISEHDMRNIQTYISGKIDKLRGVTEELKWGKVRGVSGVQEFIHVKTLSGSFNKIFLIDEKGRLYSDDYSIYDESENFFLDYFSGENGTKFARRFDDPDRKLLKRATREYLLYGYDFSDDPFRIGGITFTAIVGLNDISEIQKNMYITGFKGKSFSSVINRDGYYIVNIDRKEGEEPRNFFDMIIEDTDIEGDLTQGEILSKIREHKEIIEFGFVDIDGIEKYMIIRPIENTNWCFINSIETSFFKEQTGIFMYITMVVILTLIIILSVILVIFQFTNAKLRKFYETGIEGVYNRRFYDDKLKDEKLTAFVMFDLDHLKYINDGSGHLAGDLAIAATGSTIYKHVGSTGYVVRYGGDEFAVAFRSRIPQDDFYRMIHNILNEIRQTELEKFPDIHLTLSIGGYYGEGKTDELFKLADALLYEAKKTRNRAVTNIDN